MSLTDREKEQLKAMIDAGQPLPPRYKAVLFDQPHEAELIWPGKTSEVTNVVLPFQSIEQIDEPRAGTQAGTTDLFAFDQATGRQTGGWANKLIWGDNKLVIASLKNGPLRRQIEDAGGLKLVYIDPPFDVGADFSFDIEVGDESFTKQPSVIEEVAYRDTWGAGTQSYVHMLYERLCLIRDLLSPDGSLYVHVGWQVSGYVRVILDEIFGKGGAPGLPGFRNEIAWKCTSAHSDSGRYGINWQTIFYYTKGGSYTLNETYQEYDQDYVDQYYRYKDPSGRRFMSDNLNAAGLQGGGYPYEWKGIKRTWRCPPETMKRLDEEGKIFYTKNGVPRLKRYLDEAKGLSCQTLWADKAVQYVVSWGQENTGYETQKSESLLSRIIDASSKPGDLIADFFCGSGTTLAVAEKLGRKWIGADLGRFAIHTSRKRMIGVQRGLQEAGKPYRSFEILNLGKYERQYFAGIDPTLPEEQRRAISLQKEEHYLTLILSAYKAERVFQSPPFHGKKAGALVLVGPIDAPVTQSQVHEAVEAARKLRVSKLDILGFEFEMGIVPHAQDEARAKGVNVALRYIPKDVFDRRAVDKGQVAFYDVAYVDVQPVVKGASVTVRLKDFGVYYRQDDVGALIESLKNGGSKVTVDAGQVVKITKDKKGVVSREVLTKAWSDWVDYWAVDFDFENRKEIVRITEADGAEREAWTGGYIFENEWQSFRTRQERTLELTSAPHDYPKKGRYKIGVKVIDIFGNDTTKVVEVSL
ncbi:DNA methylase N-4/N-6 domain protein [Xanthobacter versatilis]|uniref:site-specific DNA-methyltransferase (adenine-specific) n=1 Tax=Xanthobacter autotrophicus (strain ATCC BAA-1158 / Py2) TaxID=78245 RepID=A7ICR0_XANP2|nr:DNA methylase N-4/N-6 domain protein [Xanthobacter autotrophicus Py2]